MAVKKAAKEHFQLRKCVDCGKTMVGRRENYSYSECGLRSVILLNIQVFHCECGAIVPEIPSPSSLHFCIAIQVLQKKTLLSAEEVRFLRKVAGYSAVDFSKVLGMQNSSLSHWETGSKPIGKDADRLVRLACFARIVENWAGSEGTLAQRAERLVRVTQGLNLTCALEQIEDRTAGSESVRINPSMLAGLELHAPTEARTILQ